MDPIFLGLLLAGALVLGLSWFLGVRIFSRVDQKAEAQVTLIADERLIVNVRGGFPQRKMLDSVFHTDEERLYLSQMGGQFHIYNPRDGLWSVERPYDQTSPVDPEFTLLQSGCGGLVPCPDGASLWALNGEGGLVRKHKGEWELMVSDTAFVGANGSPVLQEDLRSAAVSEDGIWLVLGTRSQGFGLYAMDRHRWVRLSPSFFQPMASLAVDHVVWWKEQFWLGGPNGLYRLDMADVSLVSNAEIQGQIVDLDVDPEGGLWVLERMSCATPGQYCQRLWFFQNPYSEPEIRLEELDRYPELNLARQHFAMQTGSHLWLAGETGVYGYQTDIHKWTRSHDQPVGPTLAVPNFSGFFFGYSGGVGWRDALELKVWPLEGERFVRLTSDGDRGALAMTAQGSVYAFKPGEDHRLAFSGKGSALDPTQFTAAVALEDQILFTGPKGALLHDVRRRTYQDIKDDPSLAWLTEDKGQLVASADVLYAIGQTGEMLTVKTLGLDKVRDAQFMQPYVHESMLGPATRVRPWHGGGIGFFDGSGRLVHVQNEKVLALTGGPDPSFGRETLVDVTSTGKDLLFATSAGWRIYDQQLRQWSTRRPWPGGNPIVEVRAAGSNVFMRDTRNRLLKPEEYRPVLIGEGGPTAIGDASLNDVRGGKNGFFMAGGGHLEFYDLALRGITGRWRVPAGTTKLLGEAEGRPLALTNGAASWGDQILGPLNEKAQSIFKDQTMIWTIREGEQGRYLRGSTFGGDITQCYFRRPTMGAEVEEVMDVCEVGDGVVVAATNAGLRFYDPQARSWFLGPREVLPNGGEIYKLGEYLLFLERQGSREKHWITSRRNMRMAESCSNDRVVFTFTTSGGRGTAVDEERGLFAWIEENGAVSQWRQGNVREILPAEPEVPSLEGVDHWVFQKQQQALLMVIEHQLWRYAVATRSWEKIVARGGTPKMSNWNLESVDDVTVITAMDANNSLYLAELQPGANTFDWVPVFKGDSQVLGQPGSSILDVQMHPDGTWAFLLKDRMRWFDPLQRQWNGTWRFPTGVAERSLHLSFGRWVCQEQGDAIWWVAEDASGAPKTMARYNKPLGWQSALDETGAIWQLSKGGTLEMAPFPKGPAYSGFLASGPEPFVMKGDVKFALTWEGMLLFDLGNTIVAYDETAQQAARLPAAVQGLTLLRGPMILDGDLWLMAKERLVVLQRASSGGLVAFRFENVLKLVRDRDGLVWMLDSSGWRLWRNGVFQPQSRGQGLGPGDPIWVEDGQQPGALTSTGEVLLWQAGDWVPASLVLPQGELPQKPWGMVRGENSRWWAWGPFGIARLKEQECGTGLCLQLEKLWSDASDKWPKRTADIRHVQVATSSGLAVFSRGYLFIPGVNDGKLLVQDANPPKSGYVAENEWDDLKANALVSERGGIVYNPVTVLENEDVSLLARRPDGSSLLAERGDVILREGPGLDMGWLSWNRQRKGFLVKTPQGTQFFSAEDFVRDERLLFEEIEAVTAPEDQLLVVANRHGLWRYKTRNLGLNQREIEYIEMPLAKPIQAIRNHFSTGQALVTSDGRDAAEIQKMKAVFGDVELREVSKGAGFRVYLKGEEFPFDAAQAGFPWDRNQMQLAWNGGSLQMWSDAGLHDLETLENFRALPSNLSSSARLFSDKKGVWIEDSGQWFDWGGSQWRRQERGPTENAVLVESNEWQWQAQGTALPKVVLGSSKDRLNWSQNRNGPGFDADLLQSAIGDQDAFLVQSKAWLVDMEKASELKRFRGKRQQSQAGMTLGLPRRASENPFLAESSDGKRLFWQKDTRRFAAIRDGKAVSESADQILWEGDRLRFLKNGSNVVKEMRLDEGWVAFEWEDNRFPFDVVTGIEIDRETLLLGTSAGLQTYQVGGGFNLDRVKQWVSFGEGTTKGYRGVTRIEKSSADQPVRVLTGARAYRRQASGWEAEEGTAGRSSRLRSVSPFWEWRETASGSLEGRYFSADGIHWEVDFEAGSFAHDRLQDALEAENKIFLLWKDGYASVGDATALSAIDANYRFSTRPSELVAFERDTLGEAALILKGVYALANTKAWRFERQQWMEVEDQAVVESLKAHVASPPVFQREHLRLRQQSGRQGLGFEYRDSTASWKNLPWTQEGRLALDDWHAFHHHEDQVWVATALGLVSFSLSGEGFLILQPHHFLAIKQLAPGVAARNITDIQVIQDQLWVRCNENSDQVFSAPLSGVIENGFKQQTSDPFADGVFAGSSSDFWEWRWEGRHSGSLGVVQATLAGEPLALSGGRFPFDGATSIAFLQPGWMEMTTENGGWFQVPRKQFQLKAYRRPSVSGIDFKEIESISVGRRDGVDGFCMKRSDGSFWWVIPGTTPEATVNCQACLGSDGFWQYEASESGLRMIGAMENSQWVTRQMQRGRFLDDIVKGMPIAENSGSERLFRIPTQAGVAAWDQNLKLKQITPLPFAGLAEGQAPQVLISLEEGGTAYLGGDGIYALDQMRKLVGLPSDLPGDSVGISAHWDSQDLLRVQWQAAQGRGWHFFSKSDLRARSANHLFLNLGEQDYFVSRRLGWGDPDPWMVAALKGNTISFMRPGGGDPFILTLPAIASPILLHHWNDRLFFIGSEEMLQVRLEGAMEYLFSQPTTRAHK